MESIMSTIIVLSLCTVYVLPCVVAIYRGHQNAAAIAVVNTMLGWTLISWVVALSWAMTAIPTQDPVKS